MHTAKAHLIMYFALATFTAMTANAQTTISPADNAPAVPINTTLQWPAIENATAYDMYFGTTNPPPFQCWVPKTTFLLETLTADKTYTCTVKGTNARGTGLSSAPSGSAIA